MIIDVGAESINLDGVVSVPTFVFGNVPTNVSAEIIPEVGDIEATTIEIPGSLSNPVSPPSIFFPGT